MQTKSYTDLLSLIQSLIGAAELTTDEQSKILHLVNRRAFEAYNTSPSWSRYIGQSEKRDVLVYNISGSIAPSVVAQNYKFVGLNSGSNNGQLDTPVYQGVTDTGSVIMKYNNSGTAEWRILDDVTITVESNDKITVGSQDYPGDFEFQESNPTIDSKLEDVTWTAVSGSGTPIVQAMYLIPYAETGKDTISDFLRIHRKQAFLKQSSIEYDFYVDANGAHILNTVDTNINSAFVTYKKQMTSFTETSTDIPLEFFYYIAHSVYADFLRLESKLEDARTEETIAQTYLAQELERIDIRNNNNSLNKKFSTHVSRQSR